MLYHINRKVIPVFKSGEKNTFNNYRPISLLPKFSKVLEKLFNNRLTKYIEKYNVLFSGQYGFRKNMSVSYALIQLLENITDAIDKGEYTVGIFVDLKKAFDTINHNILIQKINFYGVRGLCANWVSSYLENRKQMVCIDDEVSQMQHCKCGVPQGSILGPTLFLLYINDIFRVSGIMKLILFADDTNMFCSGSDVNELMEMVEIELNKFSEWFIVNKLSLNLAKTSFMIFHSKAVNITGGIAITGVNIKRVFTTKFLGVYIDTQFNWKEHIKVIQTKVAKGISILWKVKFRLSTSVLRQLYMSLILPYLTYCCEVWGNTYKTSLEKLFLFQKKIVRLISKSDYRSHTAPMFQDLHLLPIYELVNFNTSLFMHKAYYGNLPASLQCYFKKKKQR